jgi:hypothetical protein
MLAPDFLKIILLPLVSLGALCGERPLVSQP